MDNNRLEKKVDLIITDIAKLSSKPRADEWMDVDETCAYLRISKRTCQNFRNKRLLPYTRVGRKILFRRRDLEEILERHMVRVRSMLPRNKGSPG